MRMSILQQKEAMNKASAQLREELSGYLPDSDRTPVAPGQGHLAER